MKNKALVTRQTRARTHGRLVTTKKKYIKQTKKASSLRPNILLYKEKKRYKLKKSSKRIKQSKRTSVQVKKKKAKRKRKYLKEKCEKVFFNTKNL